MKLYAILIAISAGLGAAALVTDPNRFSGNIASLVVGLVMLLMVGAMFADEYLHPGHHHHRR